ncbi:MAG: glycosyltransferase family 2 protein [Geitlerinemataceae cyanobacterium]
MPLKFSVVIPCYNAEPWIRDTLDSIFAQTYPANEIVTIDDGSSDRTLECLEAIASDSPVPVRILHAGNLGPAGARNVGIEAAKGDWVAFLDADDWWKPEHLARIDAAVATSGDAVYLAAAEHYADRHGRVVSMSDVPFDTLRTNISPHEYFELYRRHGLLEFSGCAIERQRLIEIGGLRPEFRGAEDFEVVLRAIHERSVAYDPVPSSYYRCDNPNSHSRNLDDDGLRVTAAFRAFQSLQGKYPISDGMLANRARTIASKSLTTCTPKARARVMGIVRPYLSAPQKLIFGLASLFPGLYAALNNLRNRLRKPKYPPRKVVDS